MALHQRNTGELLSPVVVVTVLARQIELADPRRIELAAGVDEWLGFLVVYDCDRKSARLRSEEHTSELQSRSDLVCRLLLEKKTNTWGRTWRASRRGGRDST